ncbi:hypothetical protein [Clostridium chauvoei]|uniref:Uncharacterized protein n=2 Tax=Clostridium chauvoei TaxID=46867 RepID=A0A1U6JBY4_9CLOT|nr:hypothetical protein [Clostridium chauvoei]ATD55034.1 hypothetical protein BTM20_07195 [Clostridium chauvoei]ATD57291.1 hypothetical protein BTM21_05860 [Clostridium chauvoei]MBX7279375.1 hypothetical protein [Clostridium chauvoei]MBX7283853.1 hypothetical protein [Clostridium chauvoei]MBX7285573.1 hypothetical protein [Clostridium chauvoei]
MLDLKGKFIKQFLKFKVVRNIPGEILLKFSDNIKIEDKFKKYDVFILKGAKLLEGIKNIDFDYSRNLIGVSYDIKKLDANKVIKWVNIIIDTICSNTSFIEENIDNNLDDITNKIESELNKKKKKI